MSDVAKTILEQLGGNKFVAMTGARNMTSEEKALNIKFPARFAKDGINCVKITLTAMDTYEMTFYRIGRAPSFKTTVASEHYNVYADQLCKIFTSVTGLAVSL